MSKIDPKLLRGAFGSYMTGVTVVTSKADDGTPIGFTANSFSSVSLDPPLLLVCPGKFLSTYDSFANCSKFAVNILAEGQENVASVFASFKGDRFACVPHQTDPMGNIMIDGAIAQFSCTTHRVVDVGDHAVLIGEVQRLTHRAGRGLGYVDGQFFSLGLERAALEPAGRKPLGGAIITLGQTVLLEATDDGYRPPQVIAGDHGDVRQTLVQALNKAGISLMLGPAYSVFEETETHCSYFLATTASVENSAFDAFPIDEIPKLKFASQPIADMMNRFAVEAQTRNFGLYVGDWQRGDVHLFPERT